MILYNLYIMPNLLKGSLLFLLILFLASCSSRFSEPEDVSSFCENVHIGSDFSLVLASLPSLALALREQPQQLDQEIIHSLPNPDSIQSALITVEGLETSNLDPACIIYFSSILHQGDGKIVYKQFVGEKNKGNQS
ncbi:MAG: hypothetical protein B7Y48_08690 [Methylophilales bacterium 28-44-11]|nr:MAG: hypothetical protein B7Y48_08690 [Methylophilales bacterium 28-44-11]